MIGGRGPGRAGPADSPEAWSTSTLELMMCPKRLNMSSRSCWLTVLGSPLMYKLASLIMSELGRANDTWWTGETEQHQSSAARSRPIGTKKIEKKKKSN